MPSPTDNSPQLDIPLVPLLSCCWTPLGFLQKSGCSLDNQAGDRSSGGPFSSFVIVPTEAFKLLQGSLRFHASPSELGGMTRRGFCPDSGSPIAVKPDAVPQFVAIRTASLGEDQLVLDKEYAAIIPVIVTSAKLYTCKLNVASISLETGLPDEASTQFQQVEMVRFRKSLVNRRSNSYQTSPMVLSDWTADRERTVFVLTPSAIDQFFKGFGSLSDANTLGGIPKEFLNPPS